MPPDVAAGLAAALAPLRSEPGRTRILAPEALHVTLVFLGTVPAGEVAAVVTAVERVARRHALFGMQLGEVGGTARGPRPGVAWLSVTEGADAVRTLALALAAELQRAGVPGADGGPVAGTRPHVTVARGATRETVERLGSAVPSGIAFDAAAVTVFRSHLGPRGSRYEALAVVALGGGDEPGMTAVDAVARRS